MSRENEMVESFCFECGEELADVNMVCPRCPPRATTGGWQPIETAPKDGEPFIIGSYNAKGQWCSDIWSPVYLAQEFQRIESGFYDNSPHLMWQPTHWTPLPEPPITTNKRGKA